MVTRNKHGLFITVCNRGQRDDHHIFETYQCSNSANSEEQQKTLNQVLNAAYTAETNRLSCAHYDVRKQWRNQGVSFIFFN